MRGFYRKSLELLDLRMQKHSENALALALALDGHQALNGVNYPFLPAHPQYELAKKQMKYGGWHYYHRYKGWI